MLCVLATACASRSSQPGVGASAGDEPATSGAGGTSGGTGGASAGIGGVSSGTGGASSGPVDEYGYSVVGVDVYPPLFERVEAKCVPGIAGQPGECTTDDECGAGFACLCGWLQTRLLKNQCVPAECRSSADCNGGKCLINLDFADACCPYGHQLELVCSRSASTCDEGGDCPGNGRACIYDEAIDLFECKSLGCSCDG